MFINYSNFSAAEKGCLGEKFFDGIINLGFFKKLKKRLQETVDFYQTKTDTCDNNEETDSRKQFYKNCLRYEFKMVFINKIN